MNTKHTFGPWHTGGDGTIVYAPDGFAVANAVVFHGRHGDGEAEANARLMAAAPDLLAKCGMALDLLLADGYGETSHPVMMLRTVIAKATA
jgi:hypothetical protein